MVKVAIIGCGSITEFRHAPEYKNNPDATIVGFYDKDSNRSEEFAKKYNSKAYSDIEEIFEDSEVDAVSICTPNHTHAILCKLAIMSGKHVLCEKPMVTNIEDAMSLKALFDKSNIAFVVGHNQRFLEAHQKAKTLIEEQYLGKVLSFKTTFGHSGPESWGVDKTSSTWFFKKETSVYGVLGDLGVHKIDLMRYILGAEYEEVFAIGMSLDKKDENNNPIEVEDNFIVSSTMSNNSIGTGHYSWSYYGSEDNSTKIYCEKGIIYIFDDAKCTLVVEHRDGRKECLCEKQIQTNDNQDASGIIDHFIDVVLNKTTPISSFDDGYKSIEIVDKIYTSMKEKRSVKIDGK